MKYTPPLNETDPNASYINADPANGIEGSIIPAGALENPQREIVGALESFGITPLENTSQLGSVLNDIAKVADFCRESIDSSGTAYILESASSIGYTALKDGQKIRFKVEHENPASATINAYGTGAKLAKKLTGSDLNAGDLKSGAIVEFTYDATSDCFIFTATTSRINIDDENLVHITGDETITGVKTFKRGEGEEAERIKLIGDGETGVTSGGVNISGYDKNGAAIGRINFGTPSASLGKMIRFEVLNNAETGINYFSLINNPDDTVEVAASGSVKSAITNWSFPSNNFTQLTTPNTNTGLTATDNGWFCAHGISTASGQYVNLSGVYLESNIDSHTNGQEIRVYRPVSKGGKAYINYSVPKANLKLYFIKAEGG